MDEFVDFLLSNNGAAFAIALLIFIVTVWLVIKRFIGFVVTIILLVFALVSGFFVANADLVREIIKGLAGRSTPKEQQTLDQLKNQFYKSFEEIKNEFSQQKQEFDAILERAKKEDVAPEKAEPKPAPKPAEK
ncbi:MAG: hypothetical protein KDK62_00220 [Chlamydiia bacterium]|nr:hypothetical protein [Chlamydiia bacterium]